MTARHRIPLLLAALLTSLLIGLSMTGSAQAASNCHFHGPLSAFPGIADLHASHTSCQSANNLGRDFQRYWSQHHGVGTQAFQRSLALTSAGHHYQCLTRYISPKHADPYYRASCRDGQRLASFDLVS